MSLTTYLVSWQIQFKLLCCQDKAKLTEKHKLESLNFARMNLKQPIEYWRTFQYTMSIAQNAMQIERVECSEHLKTSGIRSIFSKCKIWTVFVHDLQYDQLQIQGSIWFMPCGTTMNSIVNSQVLRQVTLPSLNSIIEVATRQRPDTFQQVYENFYTANNIELYRFPVMSPDLIHFFTAGIH
ncbi:Hypothetical_protein [Hexamita inflata]|uniref:Hypothetical_protein n=1 Tax=Hexamita inflata TaxID=28002 RepID=A0ABP1GDM2_9EUKA